MFTFKKIDLNKLPVKNLIIISCLIVIALMVRECSVSSIEAEANDGGWKLKYTAMVDSFTTETNALGEKVVIQDQLIISSKQANDMLAMENSSLKKLASSSSVRTVTKIVKIPTDMGMATIDAKEIPEEFRGDSISEDSTITVDTFHAGDEWFSLDGKVYNKRVFIDSLIFRDKITTNIGWRRDKGFKNLFKAKRAVVETKSANPHVSITGVQNVVVQDDKKFFQTTAFKVGVGAVGALVLRNQLLP